MTKPILDCRSMFRLHTLDFWQPLQDMGEAMTSIPAAALVPLRRRYRVKGTPSNVIALVRQRLRWAAGLLKLASQRRRRL